MSAEHKRPLVAFVVVSILCAVMLGHGIRSDALVGLLGLREPVAAEQNEPTVTVRDTARAVAPTAIPTGLPGLSAEQLVTAEPTPAAPTATGVEQTGSVATAAPVPTPSQTPTPSPTPTPTPDDSTADDGAAPTTVAARKAAHEAAKAATQALKAAAKADRVAARATAQTARAARQVAETAAKEAKKAVAAALKATELVARNAEKADKHAPDTTSPELGEPTVEPSEQPDVEPADLPFTLPFTLPTELPTDLPDGS